MLKYKKKTFTRSDLVSKTVEDMGIPASLSRKLVGDLIEMMVGCLAGRETLKVASFATFRPYKRQARKGRNMVTGEAVEIGERYVLQFKRSESLEERGL